VSEPHELNRAHACSPPHLLIHGVSKFSGLEWSAGLLA